MAEAKWWPMGEVPTSPGIYLSMKDGDGCYWKLPDDSDVLPGRNPSRQFYGPIPDPPKEPPKLRRFTARHGGKAISGFQLGDDPELRTYIFGPEGKPTHYLTLVARFLDDIQWLDPVC